MNISKAVNTWFVAMLVAMGSIALLPSASAQQAMPAQAQQMQVNINTASVEILTQLQGIGPAKANAIVEYRNKFGQFKSKDELLAVDGIGPATLDKNASRIALN